MLILSFFLKKIRKINFFEKVGNDKNSINIDEINLNEIKDNHKVFLKIDIEGSEYEILNQIVSIKKKYKELSLNFMR